jgi:hypothetical protein
MNVGNPSNPMAFLTGQSNPADDRFLTVPIFQAEIMAAFHAQTRLRNYVDVRTVGKGQGETHFYKTWKATAFYHSRGVELLGENIDTTKVVVKIDHPLVSPFALYDLDQMLSNVDYRTQFANETGTALAQVDNSNVARAIVLAARQGPDGPFPGGDVITDASLTNTGAIDGRAWLDAIRDMKLRKRADKDIPRTVPFYAAVNEDVFDAIIHAKNAQGQHYFSDDVRLSDPDMVRWAGVTIMADQWLPDSNETNSETVYGKYRANYSTTTGIFWSEKAVGAAIMMDVQFEATRDVRRQEDFQVAKMLAGYGHLRPEVAGEFKTA